MSTRTHTHTRNARAKSRWANMQTTCDRTKAHRQATSSDEWYAPIELIRSLGEFDLDPACGPQCRNRTAKRRYGCNGLEREWFGRVWLNPPFSYVPPWVDRMIKHNNGVMLVFGRVDAVWFQRACAAASGVYLLCGRIQFDRPGGSTGRCPLGCVLFGFGERNRRAIHRCSWPGIWLSSKPGSLTPDA